jgi:hypothetical protein
MRAQARLLGIMFAALLAGGCGGADENRMALTDGSHMLHAEFTPVLVDRSTPSFVRSGIVDAETLLNWAEGAYAQYFPSHRTTLFSAPYLYRYYPETGNYVGVDGNTVRALIPSLSPDIMTVGVLDDFTCRIFSDICFGYAVMGASPRPPATTASPDVMWLRTDSITPEYLTGNDLVYSEAVPLQPELPAGWIGLTYWKPADANYAASFVGHLQIEAPQSIAPFLVTDVLAATPAQYVLGLNKRGDMEIEVGGRGCNHQYSAYYLHEIALDSAGKVANLAVDFSFGCDGRDRPVSGVVRLNSAVPSVLQRAFAVAGPDVDVGEGRVIFLDGRGSWSPASKLVWSKWTQVSGPPLDLSQCAGLSCATYSPVLPGGGATAVLRLDVVTENGLSDSALLNVHIVSNADRRTLFETWGGGHVARWTGTAAIGPASGKVRVANKVSTDSVYDNQTAERMALTFTGLSANGTRVGMDVNLMSKKGSPLVAGTYVDPGPSTAFAPLPDRPVVEIGNTAEGAGCNQLGHMIIGEIDRNPSDYSQIRSLSVFAQTNCITLGVVEPESNYVRLSINHAPSNRPAARITGTATAVPGGPLELSAAESSASRPVDVISWMQIAGPTIVDGGTSENGLLLTGTVGAGVSPGTKLVFAVDVIDAAGEADTQIWTVTVH